MVHAASKRGLNLPDAPQRRNTMSWKTINFILGLAATDPAFLQLLRDNPQQALTAYKLELDPQELAVLQDISADTLDEYARQLVNRLGPHRKDA